ncbi:MAG: flagellar hook-length control protein FliK [Deferribacteraceae bacterium]|nr:flagellar hook-length control protein FliK [Deferribacteraceae bacterium]
MPEITSLFNLNAKPANSGADASAQQAVNANGNAGNNSNAFAAQLATAMGQSGESSSTAQNTTGGKNIPLRMAANATNTNPDANASPETEAESASGNISPLLLTTPVIFSEPIELAAAEPISNNGAAQQVPTMPAAAQPAKTELAITNGQQAIDPSMLIPLNKQPMGISQTAADYISGLAVTKPELGGDAAIVLPEANSAQAQPQAQANMPFVPATIPANSARQTEPVRLQFTDPIVLAAAGAEPAVAPNYPQAGGMRSVTPSEQPLYLSSLIPANRAAAAVPAPAEPVVEAEPVVAAAPVVDEAAPIDGEVSSSQDIGKLWDNIKLIAGDIKQSIAGPGIESVTTLAAPLLVANTFHEPLKMTAMVGKPMTETAKLGYSIAAAPTTEGQPTPEGANAEPINPTDANAAPVAMQASIEGAPDTTEANPQPYVEIRKILPDQFEQRTMDYMRRSIAADALVQNNSEARPQNGEARTQGNGASVQNSELSIVGDDMADGKEGQNPQNSREQQARPNATVEIAQAPKQTRTDTQTQAQAPKAANSAETNIAPAANVQPQQGLANGLAQAERASLVAESASLTSEQRVTMAAPKEQPKVVTAAENGQRQNVEHAGFQLPDQPEQSEPKQAKAEERVLRWESAKDAVNLAKLVQQAGQSGVTKLTVRLTPENLGRLEIQLTEIGGRIDAKIMANSTESRALLASNGEAIRQQLADKGIQINNMDFSFHDSLTRQDQNDHGRGAGQDAKQGRFNLAKGDKADFEQAMAQEQAEAEDSNALYA